MGYPKAVYDKAWQALEARATAAQGRQRAQREAVIAKIPEVERIEREMAYGAAGITKAVIASPDRAGELIEQLAEQNLALQERRRQLLVRHGFAPDCLAEQFGCTRCRDKGYIAQEMCSCLRELLEREAIARLSAAAQVDGCTFASFSLDYYPDTPDKSGVSPRARMRDVLAFCRRYADSFSQDAGSLLLIGQTGLGKTHLSLAISTQVTAMGFGVVYTPVQKLMDMLEADKFSYDTERKDQYTENTRVVLGCDLLVLDDLGTEFITQFTGSVLYNIINSRQVEGKPTIISTNLELAEIEQKYSQRMVSRLVCAYTVLKFAGKDVRFIKRANQRKTG